MNQIKNNIILVLICLGVAFSVSAKVSVKANLDSVNLMLGSMTTLSLEVVQDKGNLEDFLCSET